jgi:hypothetical protein
MSAEHFREIVGYGVRVVRPRKICDRCTHDERGENHVLDAFNLRSQGTIPRVPGPVTKVLSRRSLARLKPCVSLRRERWSPFAEWISSQGSVFLQKLLTFNWCRRFFNPRDQDVLFHNAYVSRRFLNNTFLGIFRDIVCWRLTL